MKRISEIIAIFAVYIHATMDYKLLDILKTINAYEKIKLLFGRSADVACFQL